MSTDAAHPTPEGRETRLAFVDGRNALAYLIIMPNGAEGVLIDAQANGISKPQAAYILRHVADQWDPQPEPQAAKVICRDCGLPVDEGPGRRDTRHDHCGPLPHTGPVGGPYCERCE